MGTEILSCGWDWQDGESISAAASLEQVLRAPGVEMGSWAIGEEREGLGERGRKAEMLKLGRTLKAPAITK